MAIESINGSDCSKLSNFPVFKSKTETLPAQKPDTVEISSKNKKKDGMSTGMKWLLGITGSGAAIYAGLVGHRAISRPTLKVLQKDFSEIFRRDVSKEEIPEMLKNYRNILKIEDEKEFCQKAFEQVKKDYGYKDTYINLNLNDSTEGVLGGGWHTGSGEFVIFYKNAIKKISNGVFDLKTRRYLLSTMFHEFQHVKQTEYCVRTNLEEYLRALTKEENINKNYINSLTAFLNNPQQVENFAQQHGMTVDAVINQANLELNILKTEGYTSMPIYVAQIEAQIRNIKQKMNDLFGKYEKFKPGDKEYEQGKKYIENYGNYIEASAKTDNTAYENQLVEKEAFHVQKLSANDIRKRLRNIWNIFEN